MTHLEQLLEIRGLLEQIDESQLCEKCMAVLAPVLLKSHEIVSVSVNEKAEVKSEKGEVNPYALQVLTRLSAIKLRLRYPYDGTCFVVEAEGLGEPLGFLDRGKKHGDKSQWIFKPNDNELFGFDTVLKPTLFEFPDHERSIVNAIKAMIDEAYDKKITASDKE